MQQNAKERRGQVGVEKGEEAKGGRKKIEKVN